MENAKQENETKDEKEQDANKGEPRPSLGKLVNIVCLEEIMGGSLLDSPSCSVDGMGQRHGEAQARVRQENMERIGKRWDSWWKTWGKAVKSKSAGS